MGIGETLLEGLGSAAGVISKVFINSAIEGGKIGYEYGKIAGDVVKETAVGAVKGVVAVGKIITGD